MINNPYTVDGVTFRVDLLTYEPIVQKPAIVEVNQLWFCHGEPSLIDGVENGRADIGGGNTCPVDYLLTQHRYVFAGWIKGTTAQLKWTELLARVRWNALKLATTTLRVARDQLVDETDLCKATVELALQCDERTRQAHAYYVAAGKRRNEAKTIKVRPLA